MYNEQRRRYFTLPDYTRSDRNNVVLEIYCHSIDENYSKLLIENKDDLNLRKLILLDKIQKKQSITDEGAKLLKSKGLIEGRKPNYYISEKLAEITRQKASYTKNKGFDKEYYQNLIVKHIKNHNYASRLEIDELLLNILPNHKKGHINIIISEMLYFR